MAGHLLRTLLPLAAVFAVVFRAGVAFGRAGAAADAHVHTDGCAQALTQITEEY